MKEKISELIDLYDAGEIKKEDLIHALFSINDPWVKYDFNDLSSRPIEYGKYFVCRKDVKIHWETWNGSGWAYNNNSITHWKKIIKPEE